MASPDHARSRSPRRSTSPTSRPARKRSPPRKSRMGGGFKWKDKNNKDKDRDEDDRDRRGPRNDSYRPNRYNNDRTNRGRSDNQDRDKDRERFSAGDEARRGEHRSRRDKDDQQTRSSDSKSTPKQAAPAPRSNAAPAFITVFVNDRLGTKAQIPCLPSDTIGDFKKIVAASIGRKPHEIMLKRQGERPMKDAITLADYEISNGVQLDLELDTGDG